MLSLTVNDWLVPTIVVGISAGWLWLLMRCIPKGGDDGS